MAIKDQALEAINQYITANGTREITGSLLNSVLKLVVEAGTNTEMIAQSIIDGTAFYGVPVKDATPVDNEYIVVRTQSGQGVLLPIQYLAAQIGLYDVIEVKPVQGGSSSASPTILEAQPEGVERKMTNVVGWFKYGTDPAFEAKTGFSNTIWWDGDTWSLGSSVALPVNPADGLVAKGETKAPNGDKVYKSIQPIQNTIDGIKTSGVISNDDYTLSNTSEYTRINILSTILEDGKLSKSVIRVSKIGALKIIFCSKLSAIGYKIESIIDVNISALGSNELIKGIHFGDVDVKKGWYTGFIVPAGGAVPMLKNVNGGSVSYASNNKTTVGDTLSVTAANTEWAIGVYVQGNSFETSIKSKLDISAVDVFKSGNLAKDSYYLTGIYITSGTGNKVLAAGWGTYRVKIDVGTEQITFGNFSMAGGGYSAFYNNLDDPKVAGADNLVEYAGAHGDTLLPRTVNVPELIKTEGGWYYISVKRPADDRVKSEKTVINVGATLMDYALPEEVTGISGIPLKAASAPVSKSQDRYVQEFWSNRKATFSFIFDDINDTDELVYSIFKEFGFKPSFALKTSNLNSQVVKERYKQWYNEGCAMLSHSVTHPNMSNPDNITYQQVVDELVNSKIEINKLGIVCSGFVTPQSSLHISFLPIVDKVYGYAFTGLNAGVFNKNIHPNKMNRYSIEGTDIAGNSLTAIKARIDLAIANGELLNFYAHKLPSTTVDGNGNSYLTESKLREILTYIKAKSDAFECLVRNSDEAVRLYYSQTYAEKFQNI